jgi:hypothetical protein
MSSLAFEPTTGSRPSLERAVRVGVSPASAAHERRTLLDLVSRLLPVEFLPLEPDGGARGLEAVLSFGPADAEPASGPRLVFAGIPGGSRIEEITFGTGPSLDPRLRGRTVVSDWSPSDATPGGSGEVLATAGNIAVWERWPDRRIEVVRCELAELDDAETLRDRVTPGRCLALISLLHFLRQACAGRGWNPPPVRASLVIDDPNVRRPTYGRIDFRELARHAEEHDYHVAFAHVPADFRFFHRGTVRLLETTERLSLALHGNDHTFKELETLRSRADADRVLAQALRRTRRFENKAGLRVARVMIPPHESCGAYAMQEMPRLGFEAVSLTRAFGYAGFGLDSPYGAPGDRAAGFGPADVTESGMPVIIRRLFHEHAEVLLRAFLDQPIVLYGHESDLHGGLGPLENAAAAINALPAVAWSDLETLSRSNYATRSDGDELHVQAFARRIRVAVPDGVRALVFEPLVAGGGDGEVELPTDAKGVLRVSDRARVTVPAASSFLEVEFLSPSPLDPETVRPPRPRPVKRARRVLAEARDRSRPLRDRSRRAR